MFVYNQNDYDKVPYAYNGNGKTIATSGCGVVSACICLNNLIGKELYSVKEMAQFSLSNGARDSMGTDMPKLLNALTKKHKEFSYTITNDENKLIEHLKNGGMAIANQGDIYNVFSTAGHFVVARRMKEGNIEIVDPQMYVGKYDAYSRPKRIVAKTTNGCIVSKVELGKATQDRSPAYYLITYTKPKKNLFTENATMLAFSRTYADNTRTVKVGSVPKGYRVKVVFTGKINSVIMYKLKNDSETYKTGIVYTKDVKKD